MAFWQEQGVDDDLALADLSDGTLRFICWACLALARVGPTLLCIDEPDQGLHPRALAALAGLFKKRQGRSQALLATHSSYFLTCFDTQDIAVMTKRDGEARFGKISDSAALLANLEDFGAAELEVMHRNDELEALVGC